MITRQDNDQWDCRESCGERAGHDLGYWDRPKYRIEETTDLFLHQCEGRERRASVEKRHRKTGEQRVGLSHPGSRLREGERNSKTKCSGSMGLRK